MEAREQACVWVFLYFNFESSYDVLESKRPIISFNKKTESKMENPAHTFRETNLVLEII